MWSLDIFALICEENVGFVNSYRHRRKRNTVFCVFIRATQNYIVFVSSFSTPALKINMNADTGCTEHRTHKFYRDFFFFFFFFFLVE